MNIQPNIGPGYRTAYAITGAICFVVAVVAGPLWIKIAMPIAGLACLATAASGW